MSRTVQLVVLALLAFVPAAAQAAAPACPPSDFTIVGIDQPDGPGTHAAITLDLPARGRFYIDADDGAYPYNEAVVQAGRVTTTLPASDASARKYTGGTQDRAGEPVTVGYTVRFEPEILNVCTHPDGSESFEAVSSTQTTSYTFAPNPLKKLRMTLSTLAAGRFRAAFECVNLSSASCRKEGYTLDLQIGERDYNRYVSFLPDDNLLSESDVVGGGQATFKVDRGTLRALKRIRSVKATLSLAVRARDPKGLSPGYPVKKTVLIRRGKIAATTLTLDNA